MAAKRNVTPKKRGRKPKWINAFLQNLAITGNVTVACSHSKVSRKHAYAERNSNADFAQQWEEALDQAADLLEEEARRRAYDGVDEPVYGSGGHGVGTVQVGTVTKYSDTLLIFLLKGVRPDKYRERKEVTHSGQVTHKHERIRADLQDLDEDTLEAIAKLRRLDYADDQKTRN